MKIHARFLLLVLLALTLAACQPDSGSLDVPTPDRGLSNFTGQVLRQTDRSPVPDIIVSLAVVVREGDRGVYVLNPSSSPAVYTDQNGYFIFQNLTPGEYVIAVSYMEGDYDVIADSDGLARVFTLVENETTDAGSFFTKKRPPNE